ncbi:MAG: class I SAM-dependent methyltransferase [Steroidobacteraceae bacterium]
MPQPLVHPMMPASRHDELAEQQFVVALKTFVATEIDPSVRDLTQRIAAETGFRRDAPRSLQALRRRLQRHTAYQNWLSTLRAAQELMWQAAGDCVDRQLGELDARANAAPALGSLRLDPDFVVPRYLAATDTHMMPGSYHVDPADGGVRQGAVFDKAAALYSLGRQGGQMNDMRGHTVVAHVYERFPQFEPARILEMGCTVGNSLVAVARAFPRAEVHGIDVGASLLRYAHARAAHLGVALHFAQASAESTGYPDGHFDLVFSSAMLHETSARALPRIFAECARVLRPGGVMVHLEVPFRAEEADAFALVRADYESRYNNEPFWMGAVSADLVALAKAAGFADARAGFQDAAQGPPQRGAAPGFGGANHGGYRSWYILSARKPSP